MAASQDGTGIHVRALATRDSGLAVHVNVDETGWMLAGILDRATVHDLVHVEHGHVRHRAGAQGSAIPDADTFGRQAEIRRIASSSEISLRSRT